MLYEKCGLLASNFKSQMFTNVEKHQKPHNSPLQRLGISNYLQIARTVPSFRAAEKIKPFRTVI